MTVSIETRSKTVKDYVGAPDSLRAIQGRIDEVAGTRRWVADAVRILLAAGAPVDASDEANGGAALFAAACRGNAGAVEMLLAADASPFAAGADGSTPRQCAIRSRDDAKAQTGYSPPARPGPYPKEYDRVIELLRLAETKRKR